MHFGIMHFFEVSCNAMHNNIIVFVYSHMTLNLISESIQLIAKSSLVTVEECQVQVILCIGYMMNYNVMALSPGWIRKSNLETI